MAGKQAATLYGTRAFHSVVCITLIAKWKGKQESVAIAGSGA